MAEKKTKITGTHPNKGINIVEERSRSGKSSPSTKIMPPVPAGPAHESPITNEKNIIAISKLCKVYIFN